MLCLSHIRLACFDLDDTLIKDIHSVMLPCILNGKEKECRAIDKKEENGELDYISADYLKAKLFIGLEVSSIRSSFLKIAKPLNNIKRVVNTLHEKDILSIVITVGPQQVAKVVCDIYGFDGYYGSDYEVENGVFTGRICEYLCTDSKIKCLEDFCHRNGIAPNECVAIGDGATDIPVFKYCGKSIAVNAKDEVKRQATYAIDTHDLADILGFIV